MIYSLTGKIIKKTLNAVVICCGGVGYYAQCPASVAGALPGVGNEATIYTVMNVTENDVSLYGFASEEQQACFELLTSVSGVGAKVGLAILSGWRWPSRRATTKPSRPRPASAPSWPSASCWN